MPKPALLSLVATVLAALLTIAAGPSRACDSYGARGMVRAFGPHRSSITIAHDAVADVLPATATTFETTRAGQLDKLRTGDEVVFHFTLRHDGRRLLDVIDRSALRPGEAAR